MVSGPAWSKFAWLWPIQSSGRCCRARDLIDLQLIMANDAIDLSVVRHICERLFTYRQCQAWPPVIRKGDRWAELYDAQKGVLNVLSNVDEAVAWANELIRKISAT